MHATDIARAGELSGFRAAGCVERVHTTLTWPMGEAADRADSSDGWSSPEPR